MIDESQIEYLLNGERAEADVLNRPLRQIVDATNESLSDVNDAISTISTSVDNTALLIEEKYDEIFEVTKDGNGFTRERDARLIFDAENATVSIAPGLGKSTWFYYHKGRKIESSETLTYTLTEDDKTSGGGFYLSFDKDRNFVNTGPHPDFFNTTLCFYVHYSNGEFIIEGDERHSADRDTAWHESHHREDGMVVYTLGSIDWTPDDENNVGIQITTTLVSDEDLQHLITHSPTGEEPFSQILEGSQDTVRIPTLYYDGSIRYLADKKLPWVVDALKYNDGTTLKDVPDGKFVNYFLVATNCQKYPIKLIMGRKIFDSDAETVDETLEALGLNFPEMALLYRIVLKRNNSLSTVGKCVLKSVQQAASKIIFESTAGSGGSSLSNHAQLLGRTEANAHPISAITGLEEALATKADKSTQVIAGTGLEGGGSLAANRTLSVKYGTTAGTAAQGNDSRIVNALQKGNNLSDVTNPATARSNLGLGTAATRDVGTASGNVMEVGAFGLGGRGTQGAIDLNDANYNGIHARGSNASNYFPFAASGFALSFDYNNSYAAQLSTGLEGFRWGVRGKSGGVWSPWRELIHTGNILTTTGQSTQYPMTQKAVTDVLNTKANTSTQVIAGTGLSGGGNLSANRTLSVNYGTTAGTAAQGNDSRIVNSVQTSGNQTISGLKTFSQFPVTPSAAPTADYQAANKRYVDDSAIGVGQTWQDMSGSRSWGTTYTNTTGRPIQLFISANRSRLTVNSVNFVTGNIDGEISVVVPDGATYSATSDSTITAGRWMELR